MWNQHTRINSVNYPCNFEAIEYNFGFEKNIYVAMKCDVRMSLTHLVQAIHAFVGHSRTNERHKTHNGWYSGMVVPTSSIVALLIPYGNNVLDL